MTLPTFVFWFSIFCVTAAAAVVIGCVYCDHNER